MQMTPEVNAQGDNEAPVTSMTTAISQPNPTLYVKGIDWKVKKPILKRALHTLFSRHGKVLEVISLRGEGLRGQAWIIFEDVTSATAALQSENGYTFFGRNLRIQYAKEKSDRIAKRDGTFVPKDRRVKRINTGGDAAARKKVKTEESATAETQNAPTREASPVQQREDAGDESPPSNILFAQNLPKDCNEIMLAMLFRDFSGYKEVRMAREGLAFIEFEDEPFATLALRRLNGFRITPKDTLDLKYAKV